jgi:hypothetical protein
MGHYRGMGSVGSITSAPYRVAQKAYILPKKVFIYTPSSLGIQFLSPSI